MSRALVVLLWTTGLLCAAIGFCHLLLGVASVPGSRRPTRSGRLRGETVRPGPG